MTPHEAILRVLQALHERGTGHLVTGALASNHYGIERSTKDADIVLETAPGDFATFAASLDPDLTQDPQVTFETITGSLRHIVALRGSTFQIDLFLLGPDPHHQQRFARRRPVQLKALGVGHGFPPPKMW